MSVDLNNASREELVTLEGVGAPLADAIITARPLSSIDELMPVLGEVTLNLIRNQGVTLDPVVSEDIDVFYKNLEHFKALDADISSLLPDESTTGLAFSFPGVLAAISFGTYFHLSNCIAKPIKLSRAAKKCYKVSVASTSANTTVDVTWTQPGAPGGVINNLGITAGNETPCQCNVTQVSVHARGGNASVAVIKC